MHYEMPCERIIIFLSFLTSRNQVASTLQKRSQPLLTSHVSLSLTLPTQVVHHMKQEVSFRSVKYLSSPFSKVQENRIGCLQILSSTPGYLTSTTTVIKTCLSLHSKNTS